MLTIDDQVRPKTEEEMDMLKEVAEASGRQLDDLVKVWREPSFSIANIVSSGAVNKTVIPRKVSADISIRLVPDQASWKSVWGSVRLMSRTWGLSLAVWSTFARIPSDLSGRRTSSK